MDFYKRILILSDNSSNRGQQQSIWSHCLETKNSELTHCYSLVELAKHVVTNSFDLIFVDIQQSCEYLVDVVKSIRQKTSLVIWILIDDVKEFDALVLLKAGADNYLKRNINDDEILMRVEAFFRRKQLDLISEEQNPLQLKSFLLCRDKRELYYHGSLVTTTGIEFELLNLLMTNYGEIVSREYIAQSIFKRNLLYCSQSINMHISNIRRKLRIINNSATIKSVRGNGYLLY
ncbi:response regulator transcription factor [Colwellia sp. UCD-KL20]|uniref:response regulator transcription factor n=1 Tax=Colwellia sp. UCD-KL20 TaxID=1917165 RepID=UPI000970AF4D|nr:response regulator transcription factor [Colwellia sp. UCD-KL20]